MGIFKKQKKIGRKPTAQAGRPKQAFSYYSGDTPEYVNSVKARRNSENRQLLKKRLRLVPTLIAVAVILTSVVYSTTLSTAVVVKFAGEPSMYRSASDYRTGIEKLLASSLLNRSKLFINANQTEKSIMKAFPELDAVNLALPIVGSRPTVLLYARLPAFILTNGTNAYVIDVSGAIVGTSNQLISSQRDKLLVIQDQSGLDLNIGKQALTTDAVGFILNVKAQLEDKKLTITRIVMPAVPNEVDIYIKDINYYVKTDTAGDPRIQIGDYLAVKDIVTPKEYVDVRVEEKVFYK